MLRLWEKQRSRENKPRDPWGRFETLGDGSNYSFWDVVESCRRENVSFFVRSLHLPIRFQQQGANSCAI